jgi:hypothetical protein
MTIIYMYCHNKHKHRTHCRDEKEEKTPLKKGTHAKHKKRPPLPDG